jgi:hypothetical protein
LDTETDELYKSIFLEINKKYHFIIPLYIEGMDQFDFQYKKYIIDNLDKKTKHIITSRLDNDDILHRDFVFKVQEQFDFQKYEAINFLKVLMINPITKKLHIEYAFSNHFVSLIEEIDENNFKGCYSKQDRYWNVKGEVIQIYDKPYVIETINDKNLLNKFRGFPVIRKTKLDQCISPLKYQTKL